MGLFDINLLSLYNQILIINVASKAGTFFFESGGQFEPVSPGQFESVKGGQFKSVEGGQFHRFLQIYQQSW